MNVHEIQKKFDQQMNKQQVKRKKEIKFVDKTKWELARKLAEQQLLWTSSKKNIIKRFFKKKMSSN